MRRTIFPPYTNPIARREISTYERGVPLWMRRCDTVGIVAVSLATCLYLIVRWLYERPNARIGMTYQLRGAYTFNVMAYLQLTAGILYTCVLLRCIAAGVSAAHRYRAYHRDDLVMTGLDDRQILFGQWYAALYQVRGWMVALGLVRIATTLVMAAEYQFNIYWNHVWMLTTSGELDWHTNAFEFAYTPLQFPLAFAFVFLLGLFEIWGTIGVGILAGTWIRRGMYAAITAIVLRALPVLSDHLAAFQSLRLAGFALAGIYMVCLRRWWDGRGATTYNAALFTLCLWYGRIRFRSKHVGIFSGSSHAADLRDRRVYPVQSALAGLGFSLRTVKS